MSSILPFNTNVTLSLLELHDVKCGEFKEKFKKLINDLLTDINNINDPNTKMLYESGVHLNNAQEVIRAMVACFNCILKKIEDENNTTDCINDNDNDNIQEVELQGQHQIVDTFTFG